MVVINGRWVVVVPAVPVLLAVDHRMFRLRSPSLAGMIILRRLFVAIRTWTTVHRCGHRPAVVVATVAAHRE